MSKYINRYQIISINCLIWSIVLLLFIHPSKAIAQSYSLSLSPSIVEILAKPGKDITQEFKITNYGDPLIIIPQIVPLSVNKENGDPKPILNDKNFDEKSWFSGVSEEFKLDNPLFINTNQTISLPIKVSLPESAKTGDYYFYLLLSTQPSSEEKTSSTWISANVGSNLLLSVSNLGTLNKNAEISKFDAPLLIDSFDTSHIDVRLTNTGAAYFKPQGNINISGFLKQSKYNILPQNILIGSTRQLQSDTSLGGSLSVHTLDTKGFIIGPYSVKLSIRISGTNIILEKTRHIFAFPFKLLFFFFLLTYLFRRYYKRIRNLFHGVKS